MSKLLNIAISHDELDDFIFTKMPFIPRIGEQVAFWRDDTRREWIVAEITSIIYECDYVKDNDKVNFTMVELNVSGPIDKNYKTNE